VKFHEEIEYLINLLKNEENKDREALNQLEKILEEYVRNYQYRNYSNKK
jgi:hypothetical protein